MLRRVSSPPFRPSLERVADASSQSIGTHPELIHLTQLIELRRAKKLDLAKRWLEGLESGYARRRDASEHAAWTWWAVSA